VNSRLGISSVPMELNQAFVGKWISDVHPSHSMASYLILFHLLLSWTFHPEFILLQLQREEEILAQLILGMSHYWLSGKWRAIIPRIGNRHLIIPGKWERLVSPFTWGKTRKATIQANQSCAVSAIPRRGQMINTVSESQLVPITIYKSLLYRVYIL